MFNVRPRVFEALKNPLKALPSMSLKQRKKFPGVACIYFLCTLEGRVLYVGRTENLAQRWSSHHCYKRLRKDGIDLDEIKLAWIEVEVFDDADFIEQFNRSELRFIKWYRPPYNRPEPDLDAIITTKIDFSVSIRARLAAACLATGKSEYEIVLAGIERMLREIEKS